MSQIEAVKKYGLLFDSEYTKKTYKVDAYILPLGNPMNSRHVRSIAYWNSMWSHRRNGIWKGFWQVDLSKAEDELARDALDLRGQR